MADETAQGIQAFGALENMSRKRMAYNALVQSLGPQAADPEAWGQALSAQKAAAELPYAGQQAAARLKETQATTAGTEATTAATTQETKLKGGQAQRESQFRALKMLQGSVDPQTGAVSPEAYDRLVGANADTLGIDPAHVAPLKQALTAPGGAQHLDTMEQALIAPTAATGAPQIARDAEGNTVAVRFDKYGNPIQTSLAGLTTTAQQTADTGAATAAERARNNRVEAELKKRGLDINAYRAAVTAANQTYAPEPGTAGPGGSTSTSPPASPAGASPGAGAPATPQQPAQQPAQQPLFDRLPPKGKQQALGQAQSLANNSISIDNAKTILNTMETQLAPYTTGAGSLLKNLPGTTANNLRANLATLKAQALQTWLTSMKNTSGQTGIGRVLKAEVDNASNLYGNMEQDQTTGQLKMHMDLFRQAIDRLNNNGRAAFTKMYGTDPETALGTNKKPAAGSDDIDALVNKYKSK